MEAVAHADAAAAAVERAVAGLWRQLLAVLRADQGLAANHRRAQAALQPLYPVMVQTLHARLLKLAVWGQRSTARLLVDTLPQTALRAAPLRGGRRGLGEARAGSPLLETPGFITLAPGALNVATPSKADFLDLLFPPLSPEQIQRILFAPTAGIPWTQRLAGLTSLANPDALAALVSQGMAAGLTQAAIARQIAPVVQNVRASARRVARTEAMRVVNTAAHEAHEQLGDEIVGYQVHATLDQYTRAWHYKRSGTIYYCHPGPGQKGFEQMPHPPAEAVDPSERPLGTPQVAPN